MAKAKKPPKNEGSKPDNSSEAVVLHQKLCLSVDFDHRRLFGYTELEIAVPDNGVVGLHAENLEIERVSVDGEPAEFDVFPHYQPVEIENRWCSVSSVDSAADAAGVTYISALERELVPNLLILCRKTKDAAKQQQDHGTVENEGLSNGEVKQNVKLIRIDYWVEKAEAGLHFNDKVLHTNSQIRRAHCWFPCMDDTFQRCCYDLEFTVPCNFVAVSNGTLLYQVLSQDNPPRKTFVYKLNIPIAARWISLAVAPFQILPDYSISLLSHMCLTGNLSKLQNTVGFFNSAFRHYEDYLKTSFPFGSYKQVFISPEMVLSSVTLGASMSIFSSHILFDEKIIDQTIDTRIKLSYALARQWFGVFITPETPNDEWLIEGLAGFLTDTFIKDYLGNNEARYRRYKANCSVCKADDSGATILSPSSSQKDLYGTQSIGLYGRIRSWKSVAVLQMLEKQMGPDLFKGILRTVVSRAQVDMRPLRTLSTKEFRQFANKHGNLERPFLKEFFHRWVETCGCPVLRMGFSYNKRKNMVELAAFRECTAVVPDATASASNGNLDSENQSDSGWPGMMTIKVHELDGTHDHLLTMAGDAWQLLEIKCHSRLTTKRIQKPKKGPKPDGSDDNGDTITAVDIRSGTESPLLWVRADPEMEYLADIHFNQPLQMWINQLEKDRDVVAQVQSIATLEELPNVSFPLISALSDFVADSKAFWRVRIEAAFALAKIATEDTDWAGLHNLFKFYRAKRFDPTIGLPKRNDFHDFPEYFVLEAIPHAICTVRTMDDKSPREAVEFVLQVLKYNDNNENLYSDDFWLAALVEAVGELEFGQQSIMFLSSLLKRIDRLLQFDRLMPSYNGILTISCIRTLTQLALKLSEFIPLDGVVELIKQFQDLNAIWQVRIEASRALLDIEFHCKGIDAALLLFIKYLEGEPTLRGQAKLGVHMIRLSQISAVSQLSDDVKSQTLVTLLRLLESRIAFYNVFLRHHLFCILQVLAGRRPTLYIVPRDHMRQTGYAEICKEQRDNFLAFINQIQPLVAPIGAHSPHNDRLDQEIINDVDVMTNGEERSIQEQAAPKDDDTTSCSQASKFPAVGTSRDADVAFCGQGIETLVEGASKDADATSYSQIDNVPIQEIIRDAETISNNQMDPLSVQDNLNDADPISSNQKDQPPVQKILSNTEAVSNNQMNRQPVQEGLQDSDINQKEKLPIQETHKDAHPISNSQGRKMPIFKIRVKQTGTSIKDEGAASMNFERFQSVHKEIDPAASSSVSVDAPQRIVTAVSVSNIGTEEVNSCQGRGSQMTVSIGSAKVPRESEELGRELQCTADSSNIHLHTDLSSPNVLREEPAKAPVLKDEFLRTSAVDVDGATLSTAIQETGKHEEKKKDKKRKKGDHKSHRDDPEYLERKRLKKEKKQKDKEMAKLMKEDKKAVSGDILLKKDELDPNLESQGMAVNDEKKAASTAPSDIMAGSSMKMDSNRRLSDRDMSLDPTSSRNKDIPAYEATVTSTSNEHNGTRLVLRGSENKPRPPEGGSGTKLRIKIKNRMLDRQ